MANEVVIRVKAEDAASKTFKDVEQAGSKLGSTLGTALKVGALAGGVALAGLSVNSIRLASDFEENLNKVRVVFGGMSKGIESFAKDAAKNLGLSRSAALGAAGTFGNLFTAMGIGQAKSAGMSQEILKLAADLASFNNIKPEEALEKLRAGLVGEVEPLRTLGVNLNAAAVEAKALSMGLVGLTVDTLEVKEAGMALAKAQEKASEALKKHGKDSAEYREALLGLDKAQGKLSTATKGTAGELTAAAKAQAAFALIMEQTKNAQGDFSRTSDGLANSIRTLKAMFADAQVEIGMVFLPVAAKAALFLRDNLPAAMALAQKAGEPFVALFKTGFKEIGDVFDKVAPKVQNLMSLFTLGSQGGNIGGQFTDLQKAAFQLGQFFSEVMVPAFNNAREAVSLFFLALQGGDAGGNLTTLQATFLNLGATVRTMWQEEIQPALVAFADIVVTTVKTVNENWNTIGPVVKFMAEFTIARIGGMLQAFKGVVAIVSGVVRTVDAIIHGEWKKAWESLQSVVQGVVDVFLGSIKSMFGNLPQVMYDIGKDALDGLWTGMVSKWLDIKGWLQQKAKDIAGIVSSVLEVFSPSRVMHSIGVNIMQGLANGLNEGFEKSVSAVMNDASKRLSHYGSFPNSRNPSGTGGSIAPLSGSHQIMAGRALPRQQTGSYPRSTSAGGVTVVINNAGSVLTNQDLVRQITDVFQGGGFRGVSTGHA